MLCFAPQVDGCHARLDNLRHYHQRYKVCNEHLRMPELMHQGIIQRFCQQCSRFHAITEFEGDRRSCKARLDRHNQRRRRKAAERGRGRKVGGYALSALKSERGPNRTPQHRRRSLDEIHANDSVDGDSSGDRDSPIQLRLRSARLATKPRPVWSDLKASDEEADASTEGEPAEGTEHEEATTVRLPTKTRGRRGIHPRVASNPLLRNSNLKPWAEILDPARPDELSQNWRGTAAISNYAIDPAFFYGSHNGNAEADGRVHPPVTPAHREDWARGGRVRNNRQRLAEEGRRRSFGDSGPLIAPQRISSPLPPFIPPSDVLSPQQSLQSTRLHPRSSSTPSLASIGGSMTLVAGGTPPRQTVRQPRLPDIGSCSQQQPSPSRPSPSRLVIHSGSGGPRIGEHRDVLAFRAGQSKFEPITHPSESTSGSPAGIPGHVGLRPVDDASSGSAARSSSLPLTEPLLPIHLQYLHLPALPAPSYPETSTAASPRQEEVRLGAHSAPIHATKDSLPLLVDEAHFDLASEGIGDPVTLLFNDEMLRPAEKAHQHENKSISPVQTNRDVVNSMLDFLLSDSMADSGSSEALPLQLQLAPLSPGNCLGQQRPSNDSSIEQTPQKLSEVDKLADHSPQHHVTPAQEEVAAAEHS